MVDTGKFKVRFDTYNLLQKLTSQEIGEVLESILLMKVFVILNSLIKFELSFSMFGGKSIDVLST